MKIRLLIILLFCSSFYCAFAQDLSSEGKDFWVGYGFHNGMPGFLNGGIPDDNGGGQKMLLYFANTSRTSPAKVTVKAPWRIDPKTKKPWQKNYTIPAGGSLVSDTIPQWFAPVNNGTPATAIDNRFSCVLWNTGIHEKGIHVTSDVPIAAYAHIYESACSGATLLYPTNVLGAEYYTLSYKQISNTDADNSMFFVIATEDSTMVEITPSAKTTVDSLTHTAHAAGVPYTVMLAKAGFIYNVLGELTAGSTNNAGVDLTGSHIKVLGNGGKAVCKRIAVFSGTGRVAIPNCSSGVSSSDNFILQVLPVGAWGKNYLTTPTYTNDTTAPIHGFGDIYRICVADPNTVVKLNGTTINRATLQRNFYYEIKSKTTNRITADKPIMVAQYITSADCGFEDGDPEMFFLSPIEQTIDTVTFYSSKNYSINESYVNVIMKTSGIPSFKLDGLRPAANKFYPPKSGWKRFPVNQDSSYSYASFVVSTSAAHTILADSASGGFVGIVYGLGSVESWGYNVGSNVKDFSNVLLFDNPYDTNNVAKITCRNNYVYPKIAIPYDTSQIFGIKWDLSNNPNVTPSAPVVQNVHLIPDSSFIKNGVKLYSYKCDSAFYFSALGTYNIKITASYLTGNGCVSTKEYDYPVTVVDGGVVKFSLNYNTCKSDTIKFSDSSKPYGNIPLKSWLWTFGDTSKGDTSRFTYHIYSKDTLYNVKLRIVNAAGCYSDSVIALDLSKTLISKFGVSSNNICLGTPIVFSDSSIHKGQGGNIIKWYWNYGDSTKRDTLLNNTPFTHTYFKFGTFYATLQVETSAGCVSTIDSVKIIVNPVPVADFKLPLGYCPNVSSTFINLTDTTKLNPIKYAWTFGDTNPAIVSNDTNPVHTYLVFPPVGGFLVTLTATSGAGCVSKTVTKVFSNAYPKPIANFTASSNNKCLYDSITFIDNSTPASNVTKWYWYFGDNTKDSVKNPIHKYSANGSYNVKLVVVSDKGCISDTSNAATVSINPIPKVVFNKIPDICSNASPYTITQASDANNLPGTFSYSGVGITGNIFNPLNSGLGIDTIKAVYTTGFGCKDSAKQAIKVLAVPTANFNTSGKTVCTGVPINFTDASISNDPNNPIVKWLWDFGNSTVISATTNTTQTQTFNTVKGYSISLIVTGTGGCVSIPFTKSITVQTSPIASFSFPDELCLTTSATFTNVSFQPVGDSLSYVWDFGDNSKKDSITVSPIHNYSGFGPYSVNLKTISKFGCADDTTIVLDNIYSLIKLNPGDKLVEGFEDHAYNNNPDYFPPVSINGARTHITQSPIDAVTWKHVYNSRDNILASEGVAAAYMNNYNYVGNNQIDELKSPVIQLPLFTGGIDTAFVKFDVAAKTNTSIAGNTSLPDTLELLMSKDCGASWNTIYSASGSKLQTVHDGSESISGAFIVNKSSYWRTDSVNITAFDPTVLTSAAQLRFKIRNKNHNENNIYIDNFQVYVKNVSGSIIWPLPFQSTFYVLHSHPPQDMTYVLIHDYLGRKLYEKRYNTDAPNPLKISPGFDNVPYFANGMYYITLGFKNDVREVHKIIKE